MSINDPRAPRDSYSARDPRGGGYGFAWLWILIIIIIIGFGWGGWHGGWWGSSGANTGPVRLRRRQRPAGNSCFVTGRRLISPLIGFNAGASLDQTGSSFRGKTAARHIARTGSALVHPVRCVPVPARFAAGHWLGVRVGPSLPAHYVWFGPFGAFAWAVQTLRHFLKAVPVHLVQA